VDQKQIGILNWFQIRSELQTLYREEIRQVTKTNSNHFFLVDFVIFDLFSSLGHSYFLMILRIQHISFVFNSFFGEISKALEIDSREHRQGITLCEAAPSYGGFWNCHSLAWSWLDRKISMTSFHRKISMGKHHVITFFFW